jgi:hypothetical protein
MQRTLIVMMALVSVWTFSARAQEPATSPAPESAAATPETTAPLAPKLVCEEATFNFGEMDNSKFVEHRFVLKNEGNITLEIGAVRASCGCTVANISQKSVPPGGTTEVSARLSLTGRQGSQNKTITVESNDPQQPRFTLTLTGTAISEMQMRPTQMFFGRITSGAIVTGAVEITIESTNAVKILKAEASTQELTVKTEPGSGPKMHRIVVTTQPPLTKGQLRASVHLETDYSKYGALDFPVTAFVVSDLSFSPEEITVVGQTNQPMTRVVVLRSETGKPFQVESVEPPVPTMQAKVVPMDNAVQIELNNILAVPELDGQVLRIKTTMEGLREILIPFRVVPASGFPPPAAR